MTIFHWEKSSVFDSTGSNDFSQTRCLGTIATNVLIYARKRKSETDLGKMIKIMEELLKIEKNEKILSHMHSYPKKGIKNRKNNLMNSDRFYFCVTT